MRKLLLGILIVVITPIYLAAFITVHELGHVAMLRLFGDREAWFYLVKLDGQNVQCLGCTTSSQEGFSWAENVTISLGGLFGTQTVALLAIILLFFLRPHKGWVRTLLSMIALTFAFLDVPYQVYQGLYYNLDWMTYQTSIDLSDFLLLLQMRLDAGQSLLKGLLLAGAVIYLVGFVWLYRRSRMASEPREPSLIPVQG